MSPDKNTPRITHVIFDMDGLLLDTESRYEIAISTVTKRYGHEYPFDLKRKIMGRTGAEGSQIIINDLSLPLTLDQYAEQVDQEFRKVFSNYVPFMPGAERLVRHLHANKIPIAVATSSKGFTFELKTKPHKEFFKLFHHIVIASDDPEITQGKPDPQTFLVCASRFENPPKDTSTCLVFEDSTAGVEAANRAGMKSIWVPDPRMPKDAASPFLTLNSLEEFKPEQFGLPPFDN